MEEVLFQITKSHLETGMRGFPVGYCTTSYVDPQKGLFYRGIPISELAHKAPEEVIYFLLHGHQANRDEITRFRKDLQSRSHISQAAIKHIHQLPRQGHPMKLFCSSLLILGMLEGTQDYKEDCLNAIAKIPYLAATVINYHAGWGETAHPDSSKGYMENFAHMVNAPKADKTRLKEIFELFNVLHYDHGGGNLSAFVGKAIASGLEDIYGSLCGAMCALAGPRHGKANQDVLEFNTLMLSELGKDLNPKKVEGYIRHKLEKGEVIPGFGHAVLRAEDSRATIFYEYAQKHFAESPLVKLALLIRTEGSKVLKENPKIADPYTNVDAISGSLLAAAGFHYPEYFTILFGLARVIGISVQIVYERTQARGGKGTPIVRPKYLYKPN